MLIGKIKPVTHRIVPNKNNTLRYYSVSKYGKRVLLLSVTLILMLYDLKSKKTVQRLWQSILLPYICWNSFLDSRGELYAKIMARVEDSPAGYVLCLQPWLPFSHSQCFTHYYINSGQGGRFLLWAIYSIFHTGHYFCIVNAKHNIII